MNYRQLGRSGLQVSAVGIGCNNFGTRSVYGQLDFDRVKPILETAFESGITFFDTADVYGDGDSERFIGTVLGEHRDEIVIATKFGSRFGGMPNTGVPYGSRRYIRKAVEGSLRRLETDYIDLYQQQWFDPLTPQEETLTALHELVVEGKVRYIGSSHYPGWQVTDCHWMATSKNQEPFISAQNHYNLLERSVEAELVPACLKFGIGILPYFPLASGLLTGKYAGGVRPPGSRLAESHLASRPISNADLAGVALLEKFAEGLGRSIVDVAIAGLAARPAVGSVITGVTSVEQVRVNASAGSWELTPEEQVALEDVLVEIDALRSPAS
jgi:aryl-alcohol dehydrogenase-like predicted oxidoreductase